MARQERGQSGSGLRLANGRVFTGDRTEPWADAVAVADGLVVRCGTIDEVRQALPRAAEIDLEGRTLLPGLIDAHNHFIATGESLASVDVRAPGVMTRFALIDRLAKAADRAGPDELVIAFGLDHAKYQDGLPTRADLDMITTDRRLVVYHVSGHGALVNSAVLIAAGIDEFSADPPGGSFGRDASGRLNGFCFDAALQAILPVAVEIGDHGPNFHTAAPLADLVGAVERAGKEFVKAGLTTVCDAQVTKREMEAYRAALSEGRLLVRTICMPLSHQLEVYGTLGLAGPFGDSWLSIGPMKFYADGTLIGGTALLSQPYGRQGEFTGYMLRRVEEFRRDIVEAYRQGWRVGVHVQGDQAIGYVLDALEEARRSYPRLDARPRLEHAGLPTQDHIDRMATLGAITVNQPSYLFDSGDEFLANLGERAHSLQPLRDELRAGVRVVISSDSDVASYNPLLTIAAAMARRTMSGRPIGARHELTLDEALFAHTIDAAYAVGMENEIGSLAPGKLADLVIIEGDLMGLSTAAARDLSVWLTMIDGRVAFAAAGCPAAEVEA
jgi:predicted amidohydrolase YtcJ